MRPSRCCVWSVLDHIVNVILYAVYGVLGVVWQTTFGEHDQKITAKLVKQDHYLAAATFWNAATSLLRPNCTVPRVTRLTRVYRIRYQEYMKGSKQLLHVYSTYTNKLSVNAHISSGSQCGIAQAHNAIHGRVNPNSLHCYKCVWRTYSYRLLCVPFLVRTCIL